MDAIIVEHIKKIYPIYAKTSDRMKEALNPFHKKYHHDFFALNDISFRIKKGETVGIIGTNGSGKSTLLKIISNVLKQSEGEVKTNGKVSSLLELGIGFDEEYTGIENIHINGSLLGYTPFEMDKKVKEILEFADIGDFANQLVKTYSSGMLVRLAFSLAINVEPEILIIDEALAVGDIFFQAKCFHKLEEIKKKGVTILLVSHDLNSVKRLCKRAIWIEKGVMQSDGDAGIVCEEYMSYQITTQNTKLEGTVLGNTDFKKHIVTTDRVFQLPKIVSRSDVATTTGKAEILSAFFKNESGKLSKNIVTTKKCVYCMLAVFYDDIELPLFGFELETNKGDRVYGVNNYMLEDTLPMAQKGKMYYVEFSLILPKLHSGHYLVTPAIASGVQSSHIVHHRLHNFDTVIIENNGFDNALIELDAEFEIQECQESNVHFF